MILYEIRVKGELGRSLLGAFPDFTSWTHDGMTLLSGPVPDQAALFGVLDQVQALGLELLEIRRLT